MPKKNLQDSYIPTTHTEKKLSLPWVVSLVIGAIITTAVSTAIGLVGIANTDHFLVAATAVRVDKLEDTVVSQAELQLYLEPLKQSLDRLETSDRTILTKLDNMLK